MHVVSFIPYSKAHNRNRLFLKQIETQNSINEWFLISDMLRSVRLETKTIDESGFDSTIFVYYNSYYLNLKPLFISLINLNTKLIYIQTEPEGVLKINKKNNLKTLDLVFDSILTYDEYLLELNSGSKLEITFAKSNYLNSRVKNRLVCLMLSNKYSFHLDELYSYRRDFVRKFKYIFGENFDIFGTGWGGNLKSAGWVRNKHDILSGYKFTIVLENMRNINGYLSERLFDAYQSLSVPVYLGAPDILNKVPKGTIILIEDFESIDSLAEFLHMMPDEVYDDYLSNIVKFRLSHEYKYYSVDSFVNPIFNAIIQSKTTNRNRLMLVMVLLKFTIINIGLFFDKILFKIRVIFLKYFTNSY